MRKAAGEVKRRKLGRRVKMSIPSRKTNTHWIVIVERYKESAKRKNTR